MAQKKSDILESLISQLEKKQADISCFLDLIDDYMALYDIKRKLKTDIKKRGVSYEAQSASGKATIIKQNQSVKDLVAVNKQMLVTLNGWFPLWLALGNLNNGANAGLWILNANNGWSNTNWNIVSGFS